MLSCGLEFCCNEGGGEGAAGGEYVCFNKVEKVVLSESGTLLSVCG